MDYSKADNNNYDDVKLIIKAIISILSFLISRRYVFFKTLIITVFISIIALLLLPNYYTAKSSFIHPPPEFVKAYSSDISLIPDSLSLASSFGAFSKDNPNDIYINILTSRIIAEKIINKFNLMERYKLDYIEHAIEKLNGKIVEFKNSNGVISISVTEKDPELAANIANEYLNQISVLLNNLNVDSARNQKLFLEKRLRNISGELKNASDKLTNFQTKSKMIDLQKQGDALISEIGVLRAKIITTESELISSKVIYTSNSPKVLMLEAQLANLNNELRQISGIYNFNASKKISDTSVNLLEIPSITVEYLSLVRDIKIQEQVFELITKEYEFAKIKEAKEYINLKVIEAASIPTYKSSPSRTILLIAICFFSFIIVMTIEIARATLAKTKEFDPETYNDVINFGLLLKNIFTWKKDVSNSH